MVPTITAALFHKLSQSNDYFEDDTIILTVWKPTIFISSRQEQFTFELALFIATFRISYLVTHVFINADCTVIFISG